MNRRRIAAWVASSIVLALSPLTVVNHLEPNVVAVTWNPFSGGKGIQDRAGWHLRYPWVFISEIDTRPSRVCITTSAQAAVNCKLVQFVPSAYRQFLEVEGFRWYWWSNRISFNTGYPEEYRGMRDVLRGYAYSAEHYQFIRVLEEYQESQ